MGSWISTVAGSDTLFRRGTRDTVANEHVDGAVGVAWNEVPCRGGEGYKAAVNADRRAEASGVTSEARQVPRFPGPRSGHD